MGYKINLTKVDRERLVNILKFFEHKIAYDSKLAIENRITGEDIALCQKLRKAIADTNEYVIITG